MNLDLELTSLWLSSLGEKVEDDHSKLRQRLRTELFTLRDRVAFLANHVSSSAPGLTVHDITHLDALWETASLIAGDSYPINPLESFVFGSAVYLHDAALCFEAFSGGKDALRKTIAWADAFASETDEVHARSADQKMENADFSALRILHATEAKELAERAWIDPDTKEQVFLISDLHLRKHYGTLIGQIASSHHWKIEEVQKTFLDQINASSEFPRDWRVDPIKIACLLRCADALHLDGRRAPDFLNALVRRAGISLDHWKAQNWLARVDLDQADKTGSTLLITSTRSFKEPDASAWWVAFDAVEIADHELRTCNATLESRAVIGTSPTFSAKRIKGIETPERMAQFIRTEGWIPCSAKVHVSDVEHLVTTLGGRQLYSGQSDVFFVALRELVQNARDAIQARKTIDPHHAGRILIRFSGSDQKTIEVDDNGIGMSRTVLTGPFLDFGTSFWTSSLVKQEFPGLRSSKFKSVGKFGIGFYSIFMVAREVSVTTRPWDQGLNDVNQLEFKKGSLLRPLLKSGRIDTFGSDTSTKIRFKLNGSPIDSDGKIEIKRNLMGSSNFRVGIIQYISSIVAGLDVAVFVEDFDGRLHMVHEPKPTLLADRLEWLKRICYSLDQDDLSLNEYVGSAASRLRPIIEKGEYLGLAAISTKRNGQNFLSVATVGGLAADIHCRSSNHFIGYIDHFPASAKRDVGKKRATPETLKAWAEEQLEILKQNLIDPINQCVLPYSLMHFGVDPIDIARAIIIHDGTVSLLTFEELVKFLEGRKLAIFKSSFGDHIETHHNITEFDDLALFQPFGLGEFNSLKFSGNDPTNNLSFIDCLHRAIVLKGLTPRWNLSKNVRKSHFGMMDAYILEYS